MTAEQKRLLAACLIYLGIGVWIASFLGTWTDEEYSLATTAHGVGYAISRALNFELQAPLYFAILAAWRELSSSIWFARLFSLLCATAFLFTLSFIGKRVATDFDSLPFAVIVAINPFVAYSAFEIRLYALALLVSALLWLAYDAGYVRGSNGYARIGFVLLAVFGIYVQYFLAFMLAGFGLALLILGRIRVFGTYMIHAAIVGVAVLPLAIAARQQVGGYETAAPSFVAILRATAVHPALSFVFPYDSDWARVPHVHSLYLGMVLVCCLTVALSRPPITRELLAYGGCAAAIASLYVALAVLLKVELSDRYFVALFVPVAVFTYALFRAVALGPRPAVAAAFVPTVLLTIIVLFSRYRFLAQAGDWKRVAPYLQRSAAVGDVIAIFPPDGIPAFERQYRGNTPYVGFPRPFSARKYSVNNVSVDSPDDARAAFAALRRYRHIWFVDDVTCLPSGIDYGCHLLRAVIDTDFNVVERRQFFEATVEELEPRSGGLSQTKRAH